MFSIYILANGAMASALAYGLRDFYEIYIVGREAQKLEYLKKEGFKTLLYNEFDLENKNVILAFKPYALNEMSQILKGEARILISVLANTSLKELECIRAQNIARIMPNIAAKYKASTTPFILKNELFKEEIVQILTSFGNAYELSSEKQMPSAMALSGCAPAFLSLVAEALANGGVYRGLDKELSLKLTQGLFESFSTLLAHEHPTLIKESVCSPAGVSIKGVKVLEERAIRAAFMEAVYISSK